MARLNDLARYTSTHGDPITIGDVTVTPRSSALVIRLPFGGFVWNRPTGVTVRRGDAIEDIPIHDVTRMTQLALLGGAGLLLIASRLFRSKKRRSQANG